MIHVDLSKLIYIFWGCLRVDAVAVDKFWPQQDLCLLILLILGLFSPSVALFFSTLAT